MNACLLSALCLLGAWATLAGSVTVKDGDFSFPLESVKKLKDLGELPEPRLGSRRKLSPKLRESVTPRLCSYTDFPEALKPICKEPNAEEILGRLEAIAQDPGTCEICAYAACTGC
ncbi:guanylin [Perognathus longimembris pacificus]|uniref:guanylin n=1 Tax=Perognathus longimembris pacificus TaxID=214514 RepID=UPI002019FF83|nr:guanylin [Perognathus longimembris pacificus]